MPTNRKQFNVVTDEVTEAWIVDSAEAKRITPAAFIRDQLADAAKRAGLKPKTGVVHHGRRTDKDIISAYADNSADDTPGDDDPRYEAIED